jgi:hypothetical protein
VGSSPNSVISVPRIALEAVAASHLAQAELIKSRQNPFADDFKGPLNSWIKTDSGQKIRDLLYEAKGTKRDRH